MIETHFICQIFFPGKVSYNDIHIVLNIFFGISIKKLKIELGRDGNEACQLLGIFFSFSTFLWFSIMKWFEWRQVNQWSRKFRGLFCLFKKELKCPPVYLDASTTWKFRYYYLIWFRKTHNQPNKYLWSNNIKAIKRDTNFILL